MTEIYVDADACPVKREVSRVAERHGVKVWLVSNSGMLSRDPHVESVMVAEGPDEADNWIAERIGAGDICITGDIPLASRCLEAGGAALGHDGRPFTKDNIGMALASRDLMAHLRETGDMQGGGRSFSKQDRSRFLQALEVAVQAALKV
jgi:uncharacterized protein YaiI (UPF0178 family)